MTLSNAAPYGGMGGARGDRMSADASSFDVDFDHDLGRPYAPFMAGGGIYGQNNSAPGSSTGLPGEGRIGSSASFRAPFLSPASRPSSWVPPQPAYLGSYPALPGTPAAGSMTNLALAKRKAPMGSTLLNEKLSKEDKPWLKEKDTRGRLSRWIVIFCLFLGLGISGVIIFRGWVAAGQEMIPDNKLCPVFTDEFSSLDVDSGGTWSRDVELGGFGYAYILLPSLFLL